MHHFTSFLVLQVLFGALLDTVCSDFAGAISPSQANTTAGSTILFSMSAVETAPTSLANPFTNTQATSPIWVESELTCRPPFPIANEIDFEILAGACTLIGTKIALMTTHLGITDERLGHFDPTLPKQLHAIDALSDFLQTQYGCQPSDPEGMHCSYLSRLRGEITSLLAKMEGSDETGRDLKALEILRSQLNQLSKDMRLFIDELAALESLKDSERLLVLDEKLDGFEILVMRAIVLVLGACHTEHGLLELCPLLGEAVELSEAILVLLT